MKYFFRENKQLEWQIDAFFHHLALYNKEHFDGCLSVILLGSLSRGEASWKYEDGEAFLVSDIEFFTVYPKGFSCHAEFDKVISQASNMCFTHQKSKLFHIDNTYVMLQRLSKMERKILTYDACNMGKAVVGKNVINLLPHINYQNINKEDIWDILVHRLFSVLYYGRKVRDLGHEDEYKYSLAKNSLDLMTVMLARNGILKTGFINKLDTIKTTEQDRNVVMYLDYCLQVKLCVAKSELFDVDEMEKMFISMVKSLSSSYHIPWSNNLRNFLPVSRRHIGMMRRSWKVKYFSCGRKAYLLKLINCFESKKSLNLSMRKENFVLNGYPKLFINE